MGKEGERDVGRETNSNGGKNGGRNSGKDKNNTLVKNKRKSKNYNSLSSSNISTKATSGAILILSAAGTEERVAVKFSKPSALHIRTQCQICHTLTIVDCYLTIYTTCTSRYQNALKFEYFAPFLLYTFFCRSSTSMMM